MTAALVLMTLAVIVLLVVIGLQAGQIIYLATQAKDAQLKAARLMAFYEAALEKKL